MATGVSSSAVLGRRRFTKAAMAVMVVFSKRTVDVRPPQGKVRCFASTVHTPHNQFSFAGEEGQDPGGHGEKVKVPTVGQGVQSIQSNPIQSSPVQSSPVESNPTARMRSAPGLLGREPNSQRWNPSTPRGLWPIFFSVRLFFGVGRGLPCPSDHFRTCLVVTLPLQWRVLAAAGANPALGCLTSSAALTDLH